MSNHSTSGNAATAPLRRSRVVKTIAVFFVALMLFVDLSHKAVTVPYERDEIMYFNDTETFDALIGLDFRSPIWEEPAAYIQPPMAKYIYGAYLYIRHEDFRRARDWLLGHNNRYFLERIEPTSISGSYIEPFILSMRQVATAFAVMTVLLLGFITYALGGGVVVTLLMMLVVSQSQLFYTTMLVAKPDPIYIPFLLAGLIVCIRGLAKKSPALLMLASVFGGLSMATILTGLLFFIALPFVVGLHYLFNNTMRKRYYFAACILVTYTGLWTWFIVNPSLYPNPIANTIKNIRIREVVVTYQLQKDVNKKDIIPSNRKKAALFYCVFIHHDQTRCINGNMTPLPFLNIGMLLLGLYQLFRDTFVLRKERSAMALTVAGIAVSIIFVLLPFDWPRYYLPVFLAVSVISAQGALFIGRGVHVPKRMRIFRTKG